METFETHYNMDLFLIHEFHYVEDYDKTKNYCTSEFYKDFGHGNLQYKYILCTSNNNDKYIVAKEILSSEEKNEWEMSRSCQCDLCIAPFYRLDLKWFGCPCCHGCVYSISPSQRVINKTREYHKINLKKL